MCGRFTVKATWAELVALYRLTMDAAPHNLRPRYNVCPTDPVDVVTAEENVNSSPCVGASSRVGGAKPSKTRSWRRSMRERRRLRPSRSFATRSNARAALSQCLGITSGKTRQVENSLGISRRRDGSPLLTAAGLWDEWKDRQTGERLKSCTMIITEPNDFAAEVHDRMPVFLKEEQFASWLSGEAGAGILKPAPNDYLQRWPVSKRVNSSKADPDDPALIDRVDLAVA